MAAAVAAMGWLILHSSVSWHHVRLCHIDSQIIHTQYSININVS
jgi:hypothetical protein